VLQKSDKANLQLRPAKCVFVQPEVQYLESVLSEDRISASADKVIAVRDYPAPRNVKHVQAFLGLALFYRRLVLGFAEVAKPLTELTRKDRQFIWGSMSREGV